jgi:hypothetical protein
VRSITSIADYIALTFYAHKYIYTDLHKELMRQLPYMVVQHSFINQYNHMIRQYIHSGDICTIASLYDLVKVLSLNDVSCARSIHEKNSLFQSHALTEHRKRLYVINNVGRPIPPERYRACDTYIVMTAGKDISAYNARTKSIHKVGTSSDPIIWMFCNEQTHCVYVGSDKGNITKYNIENGQENHVYNHTNGRFTRASSSDAYICIQYTDAYNQPRYMLFDMNNDTLVVDDAQDGSASHITCYGNRASSRVICADTSSFRVYNTQSGDCLGSYDGYIHGLLSSYNACIYSVNDMLYIMDMCTGSYIYHTEFRSRDKDVQYTDDHQYVCIGSYNQDTASYQLKMYCMKNQTEYVVCNQCHMPFHINRTQDFILFFKDNDNSMAVFKYDCLTQKHRSISLLRERIVHYHDSRHNPFYMMTSREENGIAKYTVINIDTMKCKVFPLQYDLYNTRIYGNSISFDVHIDSHGEHELGKLVYDPLSGELYKSLYKPHHQEYDLKDIRSCGHTYVIEEYKNAGKSYYYVHQYPDSLGDASFYTYLEEYCHKVLQKVSP